MMIGLGDRHAIKERPQASGAGQQAGPNATQPSIIAPESEKPGGAQTHEFRSEKWVELYAKRVGETIAALKSKRVPVMLVGLPPIRGTKSRADLAFINDILKAEAEKAGIVFVNVWEGFVDDTGEYSSYGPDVMGQSRRLRSNDGVYFTKAGARKLAHFVDREIKRLLNRETPIALPVPDMPEKAPDDLVGPAPRPAAGPVIPLTGAPPLAETLLGGPSGAQRDPSATVTKMLIKGEAPTPASGRADNFSWPPNRPIAENDTLEPPQREATGVRATRLGTARPAARARRPGQRSPSPTTSGPMRIGPPTQQPQQGRAADPRAASAPARPVR
jgi:hypothetical protein